MTKSAAIEILVRKLCSSERGWFVQGHWEADECAVGISGSTGNVAHISSFNKEAGRFDVSIEQRSDDDESPGPEITAAEDVTEDDLIGLLVKYVGGG